MMFNLNDIVASYRVITEEDYKHALSFNDYEYVDKLFQSNKLFLYGPIRYCKIIKITSKRISCRDLRYIDSKGMTFYYTPTGKCYNFYSDENTKPRKLDLIILPISLKDKIKLCLQ